MLQEDYIETLKVHESSEVSKKEIRKGDWLATKLCAEKWEQIVF
jgi:hypothetical protein